MFVTLATASARISDAGRQISTPPTVNTSRNDNSFYHLIMCVSFVGTPSLLARIISVHAQLPTT